MTKNSAREKYVDLEKSIRESDSAFLKKLPRFVINLLEKLIKQDEINTVLTKYKNVYGLDFLNKIIEELDLKISYHGLENLPDNGRCIFAANHPFGVLDGLILTQTVATKYGDLRAIANDAFDLIPQLRQYITHVNVYGQSSKSIITAINALYASEMPITHFPAGEVSRIYHGQIQDAKWQKSFVKKAVEHKRDIVPIYFEGRNSRMFYAVFRLRKLLGLGVNMELALLPREFFMMRHKTITVHIGKPIAYTQFLAARNLEEQTQQLRDSTYKLAG